MRKKLLLMILPLIFCFAINKNTICQPAAAANLPQKIRSYLDKNYSGWKVSAVANYCEPTFKRAVVSGDFDGNRQTDYAVKFLRGRQGFIIAFLNQGADYTAHILESGTVQEMKSQGLSVARRGAAYAEIVGDLGNRVSRRLQYDAPAGGTCESSAYFYVYRNGSFRRAFTSD